MKTSYTREFHIARSCREKYDVNDALVALTGNVVLVDLVASRNLAAKMREQGKQASAAEINLMGILDEIHHLLVAEYRKTVKPKLFAEVLSDAKKALGFTEVEKLLLEFAELFPTLAVHRKQLNSLTYLNGQTEGVPNREVVLEEMLMLWLENSNPAYRKYQELFDDAALRKNPSYLMMMNLFTKRAENSPPFPKMIPQKNLIVALRSAAMAYPHSLIDQLAYCERNFMPYFSKMREMLTRILHSKDFFSEEERELAQWFSGDKHVNFDERKFSDDEIRQMIRGGTSSYEEIKDHEYEAYSQDKQWMPQLVLMAKNAYVWLDQLSKKYQRNIHLLSHVPDEELDKLREWGVTGLWLIGLWERSVASKTIKQKMGADDAVASAYSLMDYTIAHDLGGQEAMNDLSRRAWERGIRMGSDMVPNHFGIDSTWVLYHPDRFLSLPYPPYPSYTFHGDNLSPHPNVGIYLEDHYYEKSDAAVVFKRVDFSSGETRYIYHGNDGTTMPWNDTAQLDYSKQYVREAVIQTILAVCKQFPIVRFDAAMTLAKKHIQRLWFPVPGSGDGIPSRAGLGMTRADLDAIMPQEFWREVVDRAAVEAPDTLLLAEAFWMLEGYFVRTLGMHRVYNSAFMHMLRDEDNDKYRNLIKETLEFDSRILQRYVNFMNNPDEKTAVEQFGKGDKYFGVAVLMMTLPGLPMLGHGQVEGFAEKYGMEYRRAKWEEQEDEGLINHHKAVLFPIMHRRRMFAEVHQFFLYDFYTEHGHVDENVIAYSNGIGSEKALVIYHNRFADTRGYLNASASYLADGSLHSKKLAEALGLSYDEKCFFIAKNQISGLEHIFSSKEVHERGVFFSLGAYQCVVLLDIREVRDENGVYAKIHHELNGNGTEQISDLVELHSFNELQTLCKSTLNHDNIELMIEGKQDAAKLLLQFYQAALPKSECEELVVQTLLDLTKLDEMDEVAARVIILSPLKELVDENWLETLKLKNVIAREANSEKIIFLLENSLLKPEQWILSEDGKKLLGCNTWQDIEYFNKSSFEALLKPWLMLAIPEPSRELIRCSYTKVAEMVSYKCKDMR